MTMMPPELWPAANSRHRSHAVADAYLLLPAQAQPRQDGGGGHSVFSRFSGALANDRGHQKPAAGASPPKDGSATFADFKSRLSNRFKSASSSEAPPDSSKQDAV